MQAGLNARLGKSIDSPIYASMFSFIVGALSVAIYLQFTKETITMAGLKSASVYSWLGGGVFGAIFITGTMLALPRLGMALTFGLVIAGQVINAVLLDHYNILVSEPHHMNIWRLLGIMLIMAGVVVVRRF